MWRVACGQPGHAVSQGVLSARWAQMGTATARSIHCFPVSILSSMGDPPQRAWELPTPRPAPAPLVPTPPNSTQPSIVCRPCRFESCFTDASNAEASSDVLQAALPRMQQLTCLVLDNPALDQDVLTAAAGIQTLQRLNASAQWVVLPPGHWQTTVRSLVSVPVLRVSISGWLGPQQGCKHASQAAWHSWHVCRWTGTHLTSPATE